MKRNKIVAIVLVLVFIISITASAEPSQWAEKEIELAVNNGIIFENEKYEYQQYINREDFCELVYNLLVASNKDMQEPLEEVFKDTTNKSILSLSAEGIINGKADNVFAPNDFLTREEAATIIVRMINKKMAMATTELWYDYSDLDSISDWAIVSVQKMSNLGFMKGVGDNLFAPKDNYTVEQAIVTLVRVYESNKNREVPNTDSDSESTCVHNIVIDEKIEPTCEMQGMTDGTHCSKCGEVLNKQRPIDKLEHKFGGWIENNKKEVRECSICGKIEEREVEENLPTSISIDNEIRIKKNDVYTIRPIFTPSNTFSEMKWTSSNTSVAKVVSAGNGTSGNVTGISGGTAIITVTTENGITDTCVVEVEDTEPVTSITIPSRINVEKGFTKDVNIKVSPSNGKTLYSAISDDPTIASVNTTGGRTGVRIRGESAGETEIIITTDDGATASCLVIVTGELEPISINIPETHTMNGGDEWDVPITIEPSNCGTAFSITSANSDIAKVGTTGGKTGCRVRALASGTTTITVYTDNGLSATCEVTVK